MVKSSIPQTLERKIHQILHTALTDKKVYPDSTRLTKINFLDCSLVRLFRSRQMLSSETAKPSPNIPISDFATALLEIRENYPPSALLSSPNLHVGGSKSEGFTLRAYFASGLGFFQSSRRSLPLPLPDPISFGLKELRKVTFLTILMKKQHQSKALTYFTNLLTNPNKVRCVMNFLQPLTESE